MLEASLDDEGLQENVPDNRPRWLTKSHNMDIDGPDCFSGKKTEQKDGLQKANTAMAIEIIGEFLQNKRTSRIISLVHRNLPPHWESFIQQLQMLATNSSVLRNLKHISPETLLHFPSNIHKFFSRECKTKLEFNAIMAAGLQISSPGRSHGDNWSSLWLPIDLILEDAMDGGGQVTATSAVEILKALVKALQAVNGTTRHNTFLDLWVSALRLVQRERDPSEGPVPRLDTCMCMLLCTTTLVVANIIEEEEGELIEEGVRSPPTRTNQPASSTSPFHLRDPMLLHQASPIPFKCLARKHGITIILHMTR